MQSEELLDQHLTHDLAAISQATKARKRQFRRAESTQSASDRATLHACTGPDLLPTSITTSSQGCGDRWEIIAEVRDFENIDLRQSR